MTAPKLLPGAECAKLTVGSLFAGIGGIELGLEWTGGFKTAWQLENDEYATRVLEKHWPDVRRWGDVRTFPPDADSEFLEDGRKSPSPQRHSEWRVDLICGGFPCQPVSCAGARRGDDDERWLWDEMHRVCAILRPRWVLAENVPGLLSARDVQGHRGALFGRVVRDLASLGYRVEWDCIPAAAVGAPHIRDRVFILAYANGERCCGSRNEYHFSRGTKAVRTSQVVSRGYASRYTDAKTAGASTRLEQQWSTEPNVGRVAHGVSSRVDRLRCLGNAVVPQVAQWIGERILATAQMELVE